MVVLNIFLKLHLFFRDEAICCSSLLLMFMFPTLARHSYLRALPISIRPTNHNFLNRNIAILPSNTNLSNHDDKDNDNHNHNDNSNTLGGIFVVDNDFDVSLLPHPRPQPPSYHTPSSHHTKLPPLQLAKNSFRTQTSHTSHSQSVKLLKQISMKAVKLTSLPTKQIDKTWVRIKEAQQVLSRTNLSTVQKSKTSNHLRGDRAAFSAPLELEEFDPDEWSVDFDVDDDKNDDNNDQQNLSQEDLELLKGDFYAQQQEQIRQHKTLKLTQTQKSTSSTMTIPGVIYGNMETAAHLKQRLVPNFVIAKRVLTEVAAHLGPSFSPKKVLDFGCGGGSAGLAALETFSSSLRSVDFVDISKSQRDGAEYVVGEFLKTKTKTNTKTNTKTKEDAIDTVDAADAMDTKEDKINPFDINLNFHEALPQACSPNLAICHHALYEQVSPAVAISLAEKIFRAVDGNGGGEGGVFVVVEPGTPAGFANIIAIRNMVLELGEREGEGGMVVEIVAPCTHMKECPLINANKILKESKLANAAPMQWDEVTEGGMRPLKTSREDLSKQKQAAASVDKTVRWCSFSQEMGDGEKRAGEKFSYLVVKKGGRRMAEMEQSWGRLIRAPRKKKKHVLLDTCIDGVVDSRIVSRRKHDKFDYKLARKSKWGGLIVLPEVDSDRFGDDEGWGEEEGDEDEFGLFEDDYDDDDDDAFT